MKDLFYSPLYHVIYPKLASQSTIRSLSIPFSTKAKLLALRPHALDISIFTQPESDQLWAFCASISKKGVDAEVRTPWFHSKKWETIRKAFPIAACLINLFPFEANEGG